MFVKHECETDMAGGICGCCGTSAGRKSLALVVFSCPGGRGNLCPGSERTERRRTTRFDKAKILSRFAFMQMEPEESAVRHAMSAMEDTVFDGLLLLQEVLMPERMDAVKMVRSLARQIPGAR